MASSLTHFASTTAFYFALRSKNRVEPLAMRRARAPLYRRHCNCDAVIVFDIVTSRDGDEAVGILLEHLDVLLASAQARPSSKTWSACIVMCDALRRNSTQRDGRSATTCFSQTAIPDVSPLAIRLSWPPKFFFRKHPRCDASVS
jgi:hypothetical protein